MNIDSPEYSTDGGTSRRHWENSLSPGDLSAGESVTILIRGRTPKVLVSGITNTAIVESKARTPLSKKPSAAGFFDKGGL